MAGFKANAIEALTYDFRPYAKVEGEVPEPSAADIEKYRTSLMEAIKALGLDPEVLSSGKMNLGLLDGLLEKSRDLEESMLDATAELTQVDRVTLDALPYRVSRAFMGYVMGAFFSPEA
jgi:hypothetical protein